MANKSLLQKISTQQGAITVADDGKLRYYGPTSNRHLLYEGYGKASPAREEKLQACAELLRAHGLSPCVDRALRDHLIYIYFTWIDPFFHLIDRDIFLKHMELADTDPQRCFFYSPALLYAIMAVSAPNTNSPLLGSDVEGNGFMERARILVEQELDSAEVTTAQALALMASREAAFGRDSRGWIYCGMSLRIATDLGLHCEDPSKVEASEFSSEESRVRNTAFWGLYIYDKYVSLFSKLVSN
jgi:Fungal specific transcription factor domain